MDLNLQAVSATVVLGTYFTLGVGLLAHLFFDLPKWSTFLPGPSEGKGMAQEKIALFVGTAVALATFFTAGLVMEDLSNKFVDARDTFWSDLDILPSESRMRMDALFGGYERSKVNPLGDEWAQERLLDRFGGDHGAKVGEAFRARRFSDLQVSDRELKDVASDAYYRAKNTIYRERSYFEELEEIQRRIDFSRSLALLTLFLFLIATAFAAIELAWPRKVRHRLAAWRHLLLGGSWAARPGFPVLIGEEKRERRKQALRRLLSVLPAFFLLFALSRIAFAREEREFNVRAFGYFATQQSEGAETRVSDPVPPISGVAATSPLGSTLLVVHDSKDGDALAPRVGIIEIDVGGTSPVYLYHAVDIDWTIAGGPSNDLEAACALPGRADEFLLLESGPHRDGRSARLFHLAVEERAGRWRGTVERTYSLVSQGGEAAVRDLEGLACAPGEDGWVRLLLCQRRSAPRSPTSAGPTADILAFSIPSAAPSGSDLLVLPDPLQEQVVAPATGWRDGDRVRACTDLYVDPTGTLWSAAAEDPERDIGPFRSVVFVAGSLLPGRFPHLLSAPERGTSLEGLKVEAVGPGVLEDAPLGVGTDDEAFGGLWRPCQPMPAADSSPPDRAQHEAPP